MSEQDLGPRIKRLRRRQDWSQKDLAERLGVQIGTLSRWERNEQEPTASRLRQLADVLGTTLYELLEGHEPPAPQVMGQPGPPQEDPAGTAAVWLMSVDRSISKVRYGMEHSNAMLDYIQREVAAVIDLLRAQPNASGGARDPNLERLARMGEVIKEAMPLFREREGETQEERVAQEKP